jgi:membrane-associated phospholipid phosphatase
MWARVQCGAHTAGQTVAGTLFGLTVPYGQLFLLYQAGVLGLS